jgi:hypothetical protein
MNKNDFPTDRSKWEEAVEKYEAVARTFKAAHQRILDKYKSIRRFRTRKDSGLN